MTAPLVLCPSSSYITTQWNVVFNDWFATVSSADGKEPPDFNSPAWQHLFGNLMYQYVIDDEHPHDTEDHPTPSIHLQSIKGALCTYSPPVPLDLKEPKLATGMPPAPMQFMPQVPSSLTDALQSPKLSSSIDREKNNSSHQREKEPILEEATPESTSLISLAPLETQLQHSVRSTKGTQNSDPYLRYDSNFEPEQQLTAHLAFHPMSFLCIPECSELMDAHELPLAWRSDSNMPSYGFQSPSTG